VLELLCLQFVLRMVTWCELGRMSHTKLYGVTLH